MRYLVVLVALLIVSCSRSEEGPETAATPEREAAKESSAITLATEAQAHIGLQVVTAEVRKLSEHLAVTGSVQAIDGNVAHVRPIASGQLTEVRVRVGDRVTADQTLATIEYLDAVEVVTQYQTARAEMDKLNIQIATVRQQTERNRQLADLGAIPRKEYELNLGEERSLLASIRTQETTVAGHAAKLRRFGIVEDRLTAPFATALRTPFAGIVIEAHAAAGESVSAESELFRIADLSQVWVQAEVYEKDLGRIRVGQTASITVDTYPNREFRGRISYISDILDPQTRTAKVRCEVSNSDGSLKVEMFATVRLPTTFSVDAMVVPAEAIQQIEGADVVFVRAGETTFERRTVTVGRTIQGTAEVLSGLKAGEAVVTKGAFHLKSMVLGDLIGEEE